MSRLYDMTVSIWVVKAEKKDAVTNAAMGEWNFQEPDVVVGILEKIKSLPILDRLLT